MFAKTPPMGWNSWNTFSGNISEELVLQTADKIVELGLQELGYNYVVIDDCWSLLERNSEGRIVPDPKKFPNGMKYVGDYLHKLGLKFGIYSCCGPLTCAGYPGSFEHEFIDAETFASWGVDYLKYDYCYKPDSSKGAMLYRRMGTALANCGRDIFFAACSWGNDDTHEWIKTTGASSWRSTGDIFDKWQSIKDIYGQQIKLQPYNGMGCFNDMDMLVVGMKGVGYVGMGGCSFEEYKTHFSLWAMLNSPLIIGCDIRKIDDDAKKILTNKDIIAINQDPSGRQPYLISASDEHYLWAKSLDNGDLAIGYFNMGDSEAGILISLADLGLNMSTGRTLELKELWSGEEKDCKGDVIRIYNVAPHDCRIFRAHIVKK